MSIIKATVDGQEYSPVESISTGGKTVDLDVELDLENKEVTITENGDTEITPDVGKDGIGSVLVHTLVQSGGGAGLSLLASGEYVKEEETANLTIPVTYSGTPKMFLVYVPTPLDDVGQAVMCAKWLDLGQATTKDYMLSDTGFWVYVNRKADNNFERAFGTSASIPTLTATEIKMYRTSSTCQHKANTYKWFIWGEEA